MRVRIAQSLKCFDKVIWLIKVLSLPIIKTRQRFSKKAPVKRSTLSLGPHQREIFHLFWELSCQSSPDQAHRFISDPDTDSCYITTTNPCVKRWD